MAVASSFYPRAAPTHPSFYFAKIHLPSQGKAIIKDVRRQKYRKVKTAQTGCRGRHPLRFSWFFFFLQTFNTAEVCRSFLPVGDVRHTTKVVPTSRMKSPRCTMFYEIAASPRLRSRLLAMTHKVQRDIQQSFRHFVFALT